jgi:hypothetical protein
MGLAESSLLPAWYLSQKLCVPCDYCTTTRDPVSLSTSLHFKEVHSHAPDHQVVLPLGYHEQKRYDCVIIVEDEITTGVLLSLVNSHSGQTLSHVIKALEHLSDSFFVCALSNFSQCETTLHPNKSVTVCIPSLTIDDGMSYLCSSIYIQIKLKTTSRNIQK